MNSTISAYAFEVYQENCTLEEMKSVLSAFAEDFGCSLVVSPLHDKDFKAPNLNGVSEPKKPHWHVLVHKSGTLEKKDCENISVTLGSNSHVESVDNEYNYFKYLKHDTLKAIREGKPRYNADYAFFTEDYLRPQFNGNLVNDLITLAREYSFADYEDFVQYVCDNYPQYVTALSSNVVRSYFRGLEKVRLLTEEEKEQLHRMNNDLKKIGWIEK